MAGEGQVPKGQMQNAMIYLSMQAGTRLIRCRHLSVQAKVRSIQVVAE